MESGESSDPAYWNNMEGGDDEYIGDVDDTDEGNSEGNSEGEGEGEGVGGSDVKNGEHNSRIMCDVFTMSDIYSALLKVDASLISTELYYLHLIVLLTFFAEAQYIQKKVEKRRGIYYLCPLYMSRIAYNCISVLSASRQMKMIVNGSVAEVLSLLAAQAVTIYLRPFREGDRAIYLMEFSGGVSGWTQMKKIKEEVGNEVEELDNEKLISASNDNGSRPAAVPAAPAAAGEADTDIIEDNSASCATACADSDCLHLLQKFVKPMTTKCGRPSTNKATSSNKAKENKRIPLQFNPLLLKKKLLGLAAYVSHGGITDVEMITTFENQGEGLCKWLLNGAEQAFNTGGDTWILFVDTNNSATIAYEANGWEKVEEVNEEYERFRPRESPLLVVYKYTGVVKKTIRKGVV